MKGNKKINVTFRRVDKTSCKLKDDDLTTTGDFIEGDRGLKEIDISANDMNEDVRINPVNLSLTRGQHFIRCTTQYCVLLWFIGRKSKQTNTIANFNSLWYTSESAAPW